MIVLSSLIFVPLVSSGVVVASTNLFSRATSGCPTATVLSCQNTTVQSNLCCFESPGGLILQTQFWDTDPTTGPSDSWTIHGLWPDNCDGTFSENCDPSRDYKNITALLTAAGANDTLAFMEQFWLSDDSSDEEFWEHEWSTHGTCYSTLSPSCLPAGSPPGTEAVDFFITVVKLFKTLPTFNWLAEQGITPTTSKTFTLTELTNALKASSGFTPALTCDGDTLDEISWFFNLQGSVIDGEFVQIDAAESSSCPSEGIKYPPKSNTNSVSK